MVSQEWPASEQGPDCPAPAGDEGLGAIESSAADLVAGPGERLGVYVCHCGGNISDVVDVDAVAESLSREEGVSVSRHIPFMCSDEGQGQIDPGYRGAGPRPRHRGGLHALAARDDLPQGGHPRGHEPLPVPAGQHPRAGQLGPSA